MNRNIPTLDAETTMAMKKIQVEAENNRAFFNKRTYLDTGEVVGDDEFWSLKIIEKDAPFEREQGFTFFFAIKNLEDIPTEEMVESEIESIHLDKVEPDETGDARFKITEMNEFDSLDKLFEFCHDE